MISNESVYTILTEKRDYAKVIRARVCVYRARVLDTASRNASSRVSRSNILETRSKRARKKRIVSAGRYCISKKLGTLRPYKPGERFSICSGFLYTL